MKGIFWKYKTLLLASAALVLIGSLSVGSAMAYFTTYVKAEGGYEITLGSENEIKEEVKSMEKSITLENTGKAACFARVRVYCGSQFKLTFENSDTSLWKEGSDDAGTYFEYTKVLEPGESTSAPLKAKITIPASDPSDPSKEFTDSFNIIVVQECTPALYKKDGSAYANWDNVIDKKTDIGTADPSKATGEGASN